MLKKTITFKDLDENDVTEDFYFNLTQAELAEWELRFEGGLEKYLRSIIAAKDGSAIIAAFKDIIRKTVGKRSEDGRRFVKTDEISDEFMQTDAYSKLFIELVTDANAAANFIKGVVPAAMREKVDAAEDSKKIELPKLDLEHVPNFNFQQPAPDPQNVYLPTDIRPAWEREGRDASTSEIIAMSDSEMDRYRRYLRHK